MKKILLLAICCLFFGQAFGGKKSKEETKYRNALIFMYSNANSVYEDDNIRLEIYDESLWASNKTTKTIFIAVDQSFLIHNGSARPLWDNSKKEQGDKKASKKAVATEENLTITIAPKISENQSPTWICDVSTAMYGPYSTSETPTGNFTEYDKRLFSAIETLTTEAKRKEDKKQDVFTGSSAIHFTEDESVVNLGFSIAYSFNKKTDEWNNIQLTTWISDLIFAPIYNELPKKISEKEQKGFGVKETPYAVTHIKADAPYKEFDNEKSLAIVCDWKGDFDKGTFVLGNTRVVKAGSKTAKFFGALFTMGISLASPELFDTYYKRIIQFDGSDADWGKLKYANNMSSASKERGDKGSSDEDDE